MWTGDSKQTPGGIDRAARNAKRSRQLLLAKKHGLRSDRNYYMPANLADAMIRLLDGSANEGLAALSQILKRGQPTLGQLWTSHLSPQDAEDLRAASTVLPGLRAQFEAAQPNMQRHSRFVDSELLQAVLNSQTAGVSDIHAWGLMLPSSSRVSPVTYHAVVAVRYPDLCRQINDLWELGSFASGGLPDKPPGFQLVLWDTNARINGLVATDLETLVSEVLTPFPHNAGFADELFAMTTANRPQEQFEPFGAEERLHPHPTRRNNSQFGRRNSTGINRSSAQYWIFKHQILLQWLPYRRYRRLPWQNHCRTHPVQIVNPACLPARHDGAHEHGAGDCDNCIWHPGPPERRNDMGVA